MLSFDMFLPLFPAYQNEQMKHLINVRAGIHALPCATIPDPRHPWRGLSDFELLIQINLVTTGRNLTQSHITYPNTDCSTYHIVVVFNIIFRAIRKLIGIAKNFPIFFYREFFAIPIPCSNPHCLNFGFIF